MRQLAAKYEDGYEGYLASKKVSSLNVSAKV
jgi:hypothetical protein